MILRKTGLILLGLTFYIGLSFAYQSSSLSFLSIMNPNTSETTDDTKTATSNDDKNKIQVALLLDTSGSMSGLIEQ